jgi:protein O-mannosyl-transferase
MKVDRRTLAVSVALFFGTLLLFSRAGGNDFVNYDDPIYVTENPHVQAGLTLHGIRWALTTSAAANWHPLTWISHMLDWSLFEDDPRGHHAVSITLHAVNAVLVFLLFLRLINGFWLSAFSAALFAWHPLRVESVAWIAERKDVLSGCFGLLALWAYLTSVQQRSRKWYWFSLGAFALGLLSKPMLVTLPLVMLLLDLWPLQRLSANCKTQDRRPTASPARTILLEKFPFFLLAAGSCVITLLVQRAGGSISTVLPLSARIANAFVAVLGYLKKFIWPVDLSVLYPHPGFWPATTVAIAVLLFVIATGTVAFQFRAQPSLAVGWCWFVLMLVPVLGLVHIGLHYMADRYTYLPILGIQLAVLPVLGKNSGAISVVAAVVVLAGCVVQTWNQLGVWNNSFTLFNHAVAVTQNNYLAYNNRGLSFDRAGRLDQAIADYKQSLAIKPDYPEANNNLGQALTQRGQPRDGLELFRAALEANPNLLSAHNNLGNALADDGKPAEALAHYDFVLTREPSDFNALNNSGIALSMLGRYAQAIERLEKAVQLAPDNVSAQRNLAKARAMMQQAGP